MSQPHAQTHAIQPHAIQPQAQTQTQAWCMNYREHGSVSFHPIMQQMQQMQQTQLFTEAPNLKRRTCDVSWNDGVEVSYEKRTKLK